MHCLSKLTVSVKMDHAIVCAGPVALNVLMHYTAEYGVCNRQRASTFWFTEACTKPDTAK
jgi:hypothetical protein